MGRRYKGQVLAAQLRPDELKHDGAGCPVPLESRPGVLFRGGTRIARDKRRAEEWVAMVGGDCWTWQGKRPEPFDIIAYEPESEMVDIPFGGAAR